MDEILANVAKARAILGARGLSQMSPDEFRDQKRSYVIGNAFDIFERSDTITQKTMDAAELKRLNVAA